MIENNNELKLASILLNLKYSCNSGILRILQLKIPRNASSMNNKFTTKSAIIA